MDKRGFASERDVDALAVTLSHGRRAANCRGKRLLQVTPRSLTAEAAAGLIIAAVLLAGCSPKAASTADQPSGGATTASVPFTRGLRLTILGDSLPAGDPTLCDGCTPFAGIYADTLEGETGAAVAVTNAAVNETDTADLLRLLHEDQGLRDQVAASEVIVVMTGHNDTPWVSDTDPCDGPDSSKQANWDRYSPRCVAQSVHQLGRDLAAVLGEIEMLRDGAPTAYRVVNFYNDNERDPLADPGGDAVSRRVVDAFSHTICAVAAHHRMPCVDVYHVFNGPDGSKFDGAFVASDHVHPSSEGHQSIAAELARLGFDDVPESSD